MDDSDFSSKGRLRDLALELGDRILGAAEPVADGSLTWHRGFGLTFEPTADSGLFNGRIGEAVLFAALAHATNDARFADIAKRVIGPVSLQIRRRSSSTALAQEIGLGLHGFGTLVYGLVLIGRFLDDESLSNDARNACHMLDPVVIEEDQRLECFSGAAGFILGLLSAIDLGDDVALCLARSSADLLIRHRIVDAPSGHSAWPTHLGEPSVGFAHGCTGIAAALLEIHSRWRCQAYYDAAMEAFRFERLLFLPEVGDWPDIRNQAYPRLSGWCHGAPGVGFGRLASLRAIDVADESDIVDDLRRSLRRTAAGFDPGADNLCCGNAGKADLLLEAGRRLSNRSLIEQSYAMLEATILKSGPNGFNVPVYSDPSAQAGMWQGVTGIAYTLLRFSDPKEYPSLLSFASR